MNTLQINRHQTVDLSPKEALRAHIEQLSLEMQREFVDIAMRLIAMRPTPSTDDSAPGRTPDVVSEMMEPSGSECTNMARRHLIRH